MTLLLLGVVIFIFTTYAIIKQYNTTLTLLFSGIALWALSFLFDAPLHPLENFHSSGSKALDIFTTYTALMHGSVAEVGLIIMAAGGFAKYMNVIGASDMFVQYASKPLHFIRNPYLLVAIAVIFAQIMNLFIPSASGLSMLLLVTLFPLLRGLGVTAASAAAALASAACWEFGPASGSTSISAELSGMSTMAFFVDIQVPAVIVSTLVAAVLYYFTSMYFDKQEAKNNATISMQDTKPEEQEKKDLPGFYALLPIIPLFLLLIFSDYIVSSVQLDVVTAMFLSLIITICFEFIRARDIKTVFQNATAFFAGMGDMLKDVVMLLVAAQFFAKGLEAVGITDYLISTSSSLGLGGLAMTLVLVAIIGLLAVVSGSGNAAFLAFSNLAPSVAKAMNLPAQAILLPMQTASGAFRSMSPVAGVVIAVAGGTGVSPFTVVKRTAIPLMGGVIANIVMAHML